jgi:NhaA family Na+:H+ antiporter
MSTVQRKLSRTFSEFFDSEKSSGIVLIICTVLSLILANSVIGTQYLGLWQAYVGGLSVEHWVNDGLMAIFFLLIGLELKRELYNGELSEFRNALLPIFAATGGIILPAGIHLYLNYGLPTQIGIGIPMATDIAFALGTLALLGSRIPASLKVFLVALAVIDDLAAIIIIAVFYTANLSILYLAAALLVWIVLAAAARYFKIRSLAVYLITGAVIWYLMLRSGVHATIAGVILAFALPSSETEDDEESPSYQLEHYLHKPVAFLILPIFALCNTGIVIGAGWAQDLSQPNSLGVIGGLLLGKPVGIFLLSFAAVTIGVCRLPVDLKWRHVLGAGLLGGIGFTMSIFIANLAFPTMPEMINASKMAILLASLAAGTIGFIWLRLLGGPLADDPDLDTRDLVAVAD